jgi:3-phosphoshikimate 1-carboxyvinyltransferase
MFGGLAIGETLIYGLLEGEDVIATALAMQAMGAKITKGGDDVWRCMGTGIGFLKQPEKPLDMGNSGTSTRLLAGLIAGHDIRARMHGDASLQKRPMNRIIAPLSAMGATFDTAEGGRLPMSIQGTASPKGITYRLPVASAQVKSAILLAGLNSPETVTVIEDIPTRDHTENMLRGFGLSVTIETLEDGAEAISVRSREQLQGCAIDVPSDPSSAAFPTVAAVLTEGSEITLPHICMNPRRSGLYTTLLEMGADITLKNKRLEGGEIIADLLIRGSALKGITVDPARVPSMIDEFPVLAVAASCAEGTTHMSHLGELRVKESDRLAVMAEGLKACGVQLEMGAESLTIYGNGKMPRGGATIKTHLDHRIAMSFMVLGTVSGEPVKIDDSAPIRTSFPTFIDLMNDLGCSIHS